MTFVFRRWMLVAIGTLCYFVSGHTIAQVVTCDGAAPGSLYGDCGAPGVANAPPAAKVPVLYCDQPASIGSAREQCPSAKWIPFDNAQAGSKLLTSYAGWQALANITYAVIVVPPPDPQSLKFACLPLPKLNADQYDIPPSGSARYTHALLWSCDKPDSITSWVFMWGAAEARDAKGLNRTLTLDVAQALCDANCTTLASDEHAYAQQLIGLFGPHAVVATNGSTLTRPIYARNADGTRSSAKRPETVRVGQACHLGARLKDAHGVGTSYYSVFGRDNAATSAVDALGDLYALCTVTAPLGLN